MFSLLVCALSVCVIFLKASFDYSGGTKSRRCGWLVFGCCRGFSGCWRIQLSPASPEFPRLLRAIQPGCCVAAARRWGEAGLLNVGDWEVIIQCWAFPGTFIQDHGSFRLTGWMRLVFAEWSLSWHLCRAFFFVLRIHWNLHQLKVRHVIEAAPILHFILCQLLMFEVKLWMHQCIYIWIFSLKNTWNY